MIERHSDIIENLKHFKELSSNEEKHSELLKEKKIILYAATLLDNENLVVIRLCLDILENFVANEKCHNSLISTFGIYESVEALSIKIRNVDEKIYKRAQDITEILRNSAPPSFNTRSKKRGKGKRMSNVFLMYIEDLNQNNRLELEKALIKIRGIVSFLIDMEMNRVTVRICPNVTIKEIVEKIHSKCSMKPLVVTKDVQEGTETYCDVLHKQNLNKSYLLEYPEEFEPKGREIASSTKNFAKKGSDILKGVVNFWSESFYW